MGVDLVDHGEKVIRLQAAAPMNLVYTQRFDPLQLALGQAPLHKRIIKGRPHKKGEAAVASPPFRFAVRGYAPLRRRSEGKRSRTAYQA